LINGATSTRVSVSRTLRRCVHSAVLATSIVLVGYGTAASDAAVPLPKPRPDPPTADASVRVKTTQAETPPVPIVKPSYRPTWAIPSKLAATYGPAFELADERRWSALRKLPRSPRDPSLEAVLTWRRLQHWGSKTSFAEIKQFLDSHPVWPRRARLVERAEILLDDDVTNDGKMKWFESNPPRTTSGLLKWIAALKQTGASKATAEAVRDVWRRARFTRKEQKKFSRDHRSILGPSSHWQRLDRLLWLGRTGEARAMMPLVTPEQRHLAEARIRLRRMSGGVDGALKRVPTQLMSDPGLVYERVRWRHRKGRKDDALLLFWDIPPHREFRAPWWNERSRQVRYALDSGRHEDAYLLAASHIQRAGANFAEAQWHAGWIALRYREKPDEAARYFTALHAAVKTPISRARAAYWAGRALEVSGGATAARRWFALAAEHHTTFYGQLAAAKIPSSIARLPSTPTPSAAIRTSPETRDLVNSATALGEIGQDKLAKLFFRTAARATVDRDEAVWIAARARSLGYLDISVYTARVAARSGNILTEAGYPLIQVPNRDAPEAALTLAVIRQESGFDEAARSRVGARGLMQLMPATARNVARRLDITYGRDRLTADPSYNLRLGSSYLKTQVDKFNGSYVLALAAYNAGPHRVKRWLKQRGDPRTQEVDMIDWIERIPFAETRNYVQRVLESLYVYRLRLGSPETGWELAGTAPKKLECPVSPLKEVRCTDFQTAER
jgi:soluble lytic murein transglycosylase